MKQVVIPEQVAGLIAPGTKATAIAERLGYPAAAVREFMRAHGFEVRRGGSRGLRQSERTKQIIRDAADLTLTLQQISDRYGVTRERVRQILAKATPERRVRQKHDQEDNRAKRERERTAAKAQRREARRAKTLERWAPAIAARESGATWTEIAGLMGMTSPPMLRWKLYQLVTRLRPDLRTGRHFSGVSTDELIAAREQGMSVAEIATRHGMSPAAVRQRFWRARQVGRLPAYERLPPKAKSGRAARPPAVWDCEQRPWTDADISRAKSWRAGGMTCADIGRLMRRSKNSVIGMLRRERRRAGK